MKKKQEEKGKSEQLFRWGSFLFRMVVCVVCLGVSGVLSAQQSVSFRLEKVNLKQALQVLKEKTGVNFVYNTKDVDDRTIVSANVDNRSVEEALKLLLDQTSYVYERVKDYFLIKKGNKAVAPDLRTVRGIVRDENGQPLPGVNVRIEGTYVGRSTDEKGEFIMSGLKEGVVLVFSFIGYKDVTVQVGQRDVLEIALEPMNTEMEEVVVTGIFNRRAESFTGSATTVRGEDLRRVGNQNLLTSLKNIDPSFVITDNLEFGSDPNKLPEIHLRGKTSIPSLRGDYEGNPNQPLFILDGFETTMEKVYDLNMNLVASVTLLKDAAAKAIYGAKAANGVVVIETVRPQEGRLRVSYTGSADITVPDLTSYNLCNASEKLQAEVLAGKYTANNPAEQARLDAVYNELYNEVARGVDTYWLSQPLRTGVGQKHSLYIDGGDEAMRYSANFSYNRINGVMKGSDRSTLSGMVTLSYRYKTLLFRNNLSVDNNKAYNSPYGSFSTFSEMNPYFRIYDEKGALIKDYGNNVYNPLYNATIGTKDYSSYTTVTENFYGEWSALKNLKLTARVGITLKNDDSDVFKPASHTDYASIQTWDSNYANRGEYRKTSGKSVNLAVDAGVNYTLEKGVHMLFVNGTYSLTQTKSESYGTVAIGFPSDKLDFITAGNSYSTSSKPTGSESTVNTVGFTAALNYSYDNRYLADASWRANGSSQFGANQRFGYFWSAGLGWNVHNEAFMQNQEVVNLLKIRGSLGYTGSQNFGAYQAIPTYKYITDSNYKGEIGMILSGLANKDLQWQQQYDRNIGFDLTLFNRLSVRTDFYSNVTKDLLTDISVVPSTGFSTYKDNLGETINKGWQVGLNYRVYSQKDLYVNVSAGFLHNTNKVRKIADYLKAYNAAIDEQKDQITSSVSGASDELLKMQRDPSTRYEEGQSLSAIWAVRSLGIDPVTGQEIFLKRDGNTTTTWSAADQVVCGDTEPKLSGNFGLNAGWRGLAVSLAFTFKLGGQMYNSTLVNKIENVDINNKNVDVRALTERWNTPGIETRFKGIADNSTTKSTSRFVEDLNELVLSSVNVTYDLNQVIRKMPFENIRFTFNMSDIGRLSTMKQERGTAYPFARTFSVGLTADF